MARVKREGLSSFTAKPSKVVLEGASMRFEGGKRKLVALAGIAILAALAWQTMDAGKIRLLVFVLLGGFALRIALTAGHAKQDRARYDGTEHPE
jgi:hypothetical protein